jgi:hypothetical protein
MDYKNDMEQASSNLVGSVRKYVFFKRFVPNLEHIIESGVRMLQTQTYRHHCNSQTISPPDRIHQTPFSNFQDEK